MSLRLIYGRSGSGKTTYCLNEIKAKIEEGDLRPIIVLVPEDLSFQAERNLLRAVGEKGIMKAWVLSFKRMAYRVFNEVGGLTRKHMNAAGRCMLIYRTMERLQEDLKVFKKAVRQQGFVDTMSDIITELKLYNISPDELLYTINSIKGNDMLKDKLNDIFLVYSAFEKALHEKYIDSEDDLAILADKMDIYRGFDGAEVWVDGFSMFTPLQYRIIEKILRKAGRVTITLCLDYGKRNSNDSKDAFSPIRRIRDRILKLADKNHVPLEKSIALYEDVPYKYRENPEILHIERNYYEFPYTKYDGDLKHINLFKAVNKYTEVEEAARDIVKLCREEGLRYSEISVVAKSVDSYENLVGAIFTEYGIPYFIDKKRDVNNNPIIILIISAIDILVKNWTYESVFRYLKTDLTGIETQHIDLIENYVLACGIRGSKWTEDKSWDYWPDTGFENEISKEAWETLEKINDIRSRIVSPLIEFNKSIKGRKKARDISEALYNFLCSLNIPLRIEMLIEDFKNASELELAKEYGKVWNILIETLDQVVEVTGEDDMTLEQFLKVVSIGIKEYKIGLIPSAVDRVMFGGVERLKGRDVSALYVLGVNDGVLPSSASDEGILTDMDREKLKEYGLELAVDTKEKAYDEQYIIYTILSASNRYLRVSYPIADHEGKTMRPSSIIARLKKLYGNLIERSNIVVNDSIELVSRPLPTFNELISAIRKQEEGVNISFLWRDVYKWYMGNRNWRDRCQRVLSAKNYSNQAGTLNADKARSIYGRQLYFSISRLERYARCPFSYFVQYGLNAKERRIFELTPPDLGNFIHTVLDKFSTHIDENNMSWKDLDKAWCERTVSDIVETVVDSTSNSIFSSSARYKYLKDRLKRIILRAVLLISLHLRKGEFRPSGHEVIFGKGGEYPPINIDLPSGEVLNLVGRIDRIDTMEDDEGIYVRVVDYKSGNKDFNLSDIYNGLELQLLIYLDAILEHYGKDNSKPAIPGGILYFKIDDPIIRSSGEMDEEIVEQEITKRLKMKGLLLSEVKVVKAMDKDISGYSVIIPAMLKGDGNFGSNSSVAAKEDFDRLRKHVKSTIIKLCEEMLKGNIEISPYKKDKETSCRYCSFKSICRFDTSIRGNTFRVIRNKTDAEVWNDIREISVGEGGRA